MNKNNINNQFVDVELIVITPAHNEAGYIEKTIRSMIKQEFRPAIWVIVDDGSTDETWNIIVNASKRYGFILPIKRKRELAQKEDGLLAASEIKSFLFGLSYLERRQIYPNYICKLDADLRFSEDYFSILLNRMKDNSRIGIIGGIIYDNFEGKLIKEKVSKGHVRGATKLYRWDSFINIKIALQYLGWDTLDEIIAKEKNWIVTNDEDAKLIHLRPTASKGGRLKGWIRNGKIAYYIGYGNLFILLRSIFWLLRFDFIKSFGIFIGYFKCFISKCEQIPNVYLKNLVENTYSIRRIFRK